MTNSDISSTFTELFQLKKFKTLQEEIFKMLKTNTMKLKEKETILKNLTIVEDIPDLYLLQEEINKIQEKIKKNQINQKKKPDTDLTFEQIDGRITYLEKELENVPENIEEEKTKLAKEIEKITDNIINIKQTLTDIEYTKLLKGSVMFDPKEFIDDFLEYNNTNRYSDTVNIPKDLFDDTIEFFREIDNPSYLKRMFQIQEYQKNKNILENNKKLNKEKQVVIEKLHKLNGISDKIKELNYLIDLEDQMVEYLNVGKNTDTDTDTKQDEINVVKKLKEYGKLEQIVKTNEENIVKKKLLEKEIAELKHSEIIYKIYKDQIISDHQLPKMTITSVINVLEKTANSLIYNLAGLFIHFIMEEGSKWEVIIKKNNMNLGISQLSGFERLVVNIGLKIAIDRYQYNSTIKFFIIDETFDCIATENQHKIEDIFKTLKLHFGNILFISHNEELKNVIDKRINISTDFICSKII
jgi:DNA repair exonuclease SbcCD ATPase subunit